MQETTELAAAADATPVGLAAFGRARAILIGTGTHLSNSGLPDVPAVADTLADLKAALVECCGLAEDAVQILADPVNAQAMGEAIAETADAAHGLLLVYYVGHGLLSPDGGLHLAACQSEGFRADQRVSRVAVTALPYAHLRNLVLESEAHSRVVILDCCFSGRALAGLANPSDEVASLTQVAGGLVLTSAGREEIAFAPTGARHTAFTGALLRLLNDGDPHGPQWLTLQQAYRHLATALPAAGFPRPRLRADGHIGELILAANPAYRPPTAVARSAPRTTEVSRPGVCPYPGLASFGEADQAWFRGRQALVTRLMARLGERIDDPCPVVITGASGSGKSSLLRAGLLPALTRGELGVAGSSSWPRLVFTPTADPVDRLAEHLVPLLSVAQPAVSAPPRRMAALLRRDPAQVGRILREALPGTAAASSRAILVVDQFEELFTLCEDESDRRSFIHALTTLASGSEAGPTVLVLLGVRADFFGPCTTYPDLAPALERAVVVAAMTAAQSREAIEHPAQAVGLRVEPGLVELLLADLGADRDSVDNVDGAYEPGRLPLLAHALRETWRNRSDDTLTVAAYQGTGGIRVALATTADRVLSRFDQNGHEVARQLLLRLVHIGEGSDDTRRRVTRVELLAGTSDPFVAATVLDAFAGARLISMDTDSVEITHEALLRSWPTIRAWIDNDRAGLLVQQQLIEAAHDWLRHDRDTSTLYTGTRLTLAVEWATPQRRASLPQVAVEFLTLSLAQEDQRRQEQIAEQAAVRRRGHRNRVLAGVLAVLLAGSLAGGGFALLQWQRANAEQRRAQAAERFAVSQQRFAIARGLTSKAESLRTSDKTTAIRLGLAAMTISADPAARKSLELTLAGARSTGPALPSPDDSYVTAVTFSPHQHVLATANEDGTAVLRDVSDRRKPQRIATLGSSSDQVEAQLESIAFSPNGRTLATAGLDKTVRLWDLSNPRKPQRTAILTGHSDYVYEVAFSSDGRTLATAGLDHKARLWDVGNSRDPRPVAVLADTARVAFSPDRRTLVTTGFDLTALWDVSNRRKPQRITSLTEPAFSNALAFNPDGTLLATAGADHTARLWDLSNRAKPQLTAALTGHNDEVNSVAFSPDGRALATGGADNTIRLWDVSNPRKPQNADVFTNTTANSAVTGMAFSPDGHTFASASIDSIRLWDVSPISDVAVNSAGEACRVAGGLTPDEWSRNVAGLDYQPTCPG
jgi:WD40 repeat protein